MEELKDEVGVYLCMCVWLNDKESGEISALLSGSSPARERSLLSRCEVGQEPACGN